MKQQKKQTETQRRVANLVEYLRSNKGMEGHPSEMLDFVREREPVPDFAVRDQLRCDSAHNPTRKNLSFYFSRDGERILGPFDTRAEASDAGFRYIHFNHSYSYWHATRYEGFKVERVSTEDSAESSSQLGQSRIL